MLSHGFKSQPILSNRRRVLVLYGIERKAALISTRLTFCKGGETN